MTTFFRTYGLFLAWLIALIAMIVTLYASEILQWPICTLCWYQRIALYPLVILLGIAAFRDDKKIVPYAIPFCVIGFIFAAYQYAEQMIPGFAPIEICRAGISCADTPIKWLGFITLPFLTMVACVVMSVLLIQATQKRER